ncbi:hypothetical protein PsunGV_gp075 [Pseudalatia unipuncta granulovirus]|uniref:Uncharacterized protein n=1 Tax=Pseudalatia unipuncta granulosis virus TaxID=36355 RepID=B6S6U4_GVPU|nr:hypothetical protein PsunGV_gp075 [Pseudalatia unipuncta granulovirus]ACH69425.1 unknown [Pseudalatia unipuncta granulovirus]
MVYQPEYLCGTFYTFHTSLLLNTIKNIITFNPCFVHRLHCYQSRQATYDTAASCHRSFEITLRVLIRCAERFLCSAEKPVQSCVW